MELTIDTQVMMIGSRKSDQTCTSCEDLLKELINNIKLFLVLDYNGGIRQEYEKYMGSDHGCLCTQILIKLATQNRIIIKEWDREKWKKMRPRLRAERFDSNDHKFVRTAAETDCNILVAQEKGYNKRVKAILKRTVDIIVLSGQEIMDEHFN